jgi:hypothetical protein
MTTIPQYASPVRRRCLALLGLGLAVAVPAQGQHTGPGEAFLLTDVTGPAITTGDQVAAMFAEPGPIRTMDCPVAWGVRTAADAAFGQMGAGQLRAAVYRDRAEIGAAAQRTVLGMLTAEPRDRTAADAMLAALTPAHNRQAMRAARRLIAESHGLFNVVQRIDPLRPGAVGPTRLSKAVGAYNSFVDASSPAFLAQPPEELAALHAVLNQLVIASLENEGRVADPRVVDERGLACALLVERVPDLPPPPTPVERAIEICVLLDRDFRFVTALLRPETGDTLVLVGGERRPFAEVYPEAARIPQPGWLLVGDPVTIGGVEYTRFGIPRIVRPGELTFAGQVDGVDYFVMPGERTPHSVVYFAIAPACEVQPYRRTETIRVRG